LIYAGALMICFDFSNGRLSYRRAIVLVSEINVYHRAIAQNNGVIASERFSANEAIP